MIHYLSITKIMNFHKRYAGDETRGGGLNRAMCVHLGTCVRHFILNRVVTVRLNQLQKRQHELWEPLARMKEERAGGIAGRSPRSGAPGSPHSPCTGEHGREAKPKLSCTADILRHM